MADADIFETKLTRTEVLDLILDELTDEMDKQIEPLKKRHNELCALGPSPEDFLPLLPKAPLIVLQGEWHKHGHTRVKVHFTIKDTALPKAWTKHIAELEQVTEELSALRRQREKLTENRRRAQNEIIRRSLESSVAGRKVLETVGTFKLSLKKKLLPAGAP